MIRWSFSPKRPSDKTRDPVAGEFFASDAIKNAGEALVREGIQNALDARVDRVGGVASVRILVAGERRAVPRAMMSCWLQGAKEHLLAAGNGLQDPVSTLEEPCRYLVFEDFGTTGLTGDVTATEVDPGDRNAFFYFFRAEGKTDKAGDDRGRWGIGKQVFPRSSRVQMYFGYSETLSGGSLMGGCVLRHHKVDGKTFKPDGYGGIQREIDGDQFTVPATEERVLSEFRSSFQVARRPGQHGLTIVVPWLDLGDRREGTSAFDRRTLVTAVLDGYFLPIREGRLEVSIEDDAGSTHLKKHTYRGELEQLASHPDDPRLASALRRLQSLVTLAERGGATQVKTVAVGSCPADRPRWTDDMLRPALADEIRAALDADQPVKLTCNLTVRPKGKPAETAALSCCLAKSSGETSKPCHIREDLIISNVKCNRLNGFVAIIRVDKGPLATLLGDAEGPAHTEWNGSSRNFKDKYIFGGSAIDFVSNFANEVVHRVYASARQPDRKLLSDVFFNVTRSSDRPAHENPDRRKPTQAPNSRNGEASVPQPPLQPRRPKQFNVGELENGFSINSQKGHDLTGRSALVQVAYETTKGDPLKCYQPGDFELLSDPITIEATGCSAHRRPRANEIIIRIEAPQFSLRMRGFDVNRDLFVRCRLIAVDAEH
jgi:hypothetical protein